MLVFIKIFLLLCEINLILCTCKLSVINLCEHLEDLKINAEKDWQYVAITPEISCQNEDSKEPKDELKISTFEATPNLEEIYIGETLNSIDEYAFSSLRKVQFIKLWRNKLTVIKKNTFSGSPNLRKLDLQDNAIENLQHNCFSNSSIKEIDLRNNGLTNLQVDMVNLKSLNKLILSGNQLQFLVDGCFGINVQYLDLSKNKISAISLGVFDKLIQLRYLNLSRNSLKSIIEDFGKVTSLRNLKTLDLSFNRIEVIERNSLAQLLNIQNLYLNDNKIKYIISTSFPLGTNLKVLHLHRNHLAALDTDLANKLQNVQEVTLGGNSWICSFWEMVERYLASVRPKCDVEATSGENPICIVRESLVSEAQTFQTLYNCEYDTFE